MRVALLVALVVASSSGIASAQKFDKELQAGIDAFRLGKYDEAKLHLERARMWDPKLAAPHRYLAAVAKAQQRFDECVESARKALAVEPTGNDATDTRKLHEDCRLADGRAPRGEIGDGAAIAVTANVPGATVRIGGLAYGGTPLAPRPITTGRLAVVVEKAGYRRAQLAVETLPGIVTDVAVELEAGAEVDEPIKRRTGSLVVPRDATLLVDGIVTPVADGRIALSPGIRVVELRKPGKDPWRRRVVISAERDSTLAPEFVDTAPRESRQKLGLAITGGGVVLAAFGVAAFYISRDAANDARDIIRVEVARPPGSTTPPIRTRADFNATVDRANRWATISNVSYGGALIAGGIGAYVLYRAHAPSNDAPAFAVAPVAGGAVVTRTGRW